MDEHESGSLNGNIAEVFVYNCGLSDNEVHDLHQYLEQKHLGKTATPMEYAIADFCQALFCLNEFVYIQ